MSKISDRVGYPPDQQILVADGKRLDRKAYLRTLYDQGAFNDYVDFIVSIRGC